MKNVTYPYFGGEQRKAEIVLFSSLTNIILSLFSPCQQLDLFLKENRQGNKQTLKLYMY